MARMQKNNEEKESIAAPRALGLWAGAVIFGTAVVYGIFIVCAEFIEPASRRSCNATYIVWVAGVTLSIISICGIAEVCGNTSTLMSAFGTEMLGVFLFANLATGFVNLSMNTLEVGDHAAQGIIGKFPSILSCNT